jgi:hypothetical protein
MFGDQKIFHRCFNGLKISLRGVKIVQNQALIVSQTRKMRAHRLVRAFSGNSQTWSVHTSGDGAACGGAVWPGKQVKETDMEGNLDGADQMGLARWEGTDLEVAYNSQGNVLVLRVNKAVALKAGPNRTTVGDNSMDDATIEAAARGATRKPRERMASRVRRQRPGRRIRQEPQVDRHTAAAVITVAVAFIRPPPAAPSCQHRLPGRPRAQPAPP